MATSRASRVSRALDVPHRTGGEQAGDLVEADAGYFGDFY